MNSNFVNEMNSLLGGKALETQLLSLAPQSLAKPPCWLGVRGVIWELPEVDAESRWPLH